MNIADLLQIREHMMGDYSGQAVDGRALHEALGVKGRFRDWMPQKLVEAGAILNKDYETYERDKIRAGGSDYRDYTLTLSLAKDVW